MTPPCRLKGRAVGNNSLLSLLRFSDDSTFRNLAMTTTPNSEQFADPNSRYHVASLQPPAQVRALESTSLNDTEFSSVDDNDSPHKKAEKYVQELIDKLRDLENC